MKNTQRGFTLLIAIIFMSVMLSFGLALGSLAYKQQVLASGAIESQYAFYAADAALECALYADQQLNRFAYADYDINNPTKNITCDGQTVSVTQEKSASQLISTALSIPFDKDSNGNPTHCADVTVYKPASTGTTYLFSQGYDVSCATVASNSARIVSRGLNAHY